MNEIKPVRLQRSRAKGAKLVSPNGLPVVCVTRPGVFGNPFATAEQFRLWVTNGSPPLAPLRLLLKRLPELRGKNLACWCKPGDACHADVLLELANRETT